MALRVLAPAKINLYLHVVGRRSDGYHLLDSLVAFADIGDRLAVAPADRLSLSVAGPEAAALGGLGDDNLVLRAARLLAASETIGAGLHLEKHLPIASGIGGGSSDAAAALRLLTQFWPRPPAGAALTEIAARLGADVPACLLARPAWVGGIGEEIRPAAGLPPAGIVLANPRRTLPTPAVFQARRGAFSAPNRFSPMPSDAAALAAALASRRNDLTPAALTLVPDIAAVLQRLADLPGMLLARMSGSGATCFALFADRATALAAADALAAAEPGWWVAGGALLPDQPKIEDDRRPNRGRRSIRRPAAPRARR
jgi:4-diphosphocytidyl-2-C-methyl-D-erythritol kinase